MAAQYNHSAVEKKWRKIWKEEPININDGKREKYYYRVPRGDVGLILARDSERNLGIHL